VAALAQSRQGWCEYIVSLLTEQQGSISPTPAAVISAMNENVSGH
jgi:hypothetical protein